MDFDTTIIEGFWQLLLGGVLVIPGLSLASAFSEALINLATVFPRRMNKVFNPTVTAYTGLFRETPVYVRMFFIYFGVPSLVPGLNTNNWAVGILIFSPNSGTYMSEIMRTGTGGIGKGQIETVKTLGVSGKDIGKDIIIPQTSRNILPAVINEFTTLAKETFTVSVIGLHDMMYWFYAVKNQTYADFEPPLIVLLIYCIMNKVLSLVGKTIEGKPRYDQSRAFI